MRLDKSYNIKPTVRSLLNGATLVIIMNKYDKAKILIYVFFALFMFLYTLLIMNSVYSIMSALSEQTTTTY